MTAGSRALHTVMTNTSGSSVLHMMETLTVITVAPDSQGARATTWQKRSFVKSMAIAHSSCFFKRDVCISSFQLDIWPLIQWPSGQCSMHWCVAVASSACTGVSETCRWDPLCLKWRTNLWRTPQQQGLTAVAVATGRHGVGTCTPAAAPQE